MRRTGYYRKMFGPPHQIQAMGANLPRKLALCETLAISPIPTGLHGRRGFDITSDVAKEGSMRQGIHPDYHEITVVMTDGTSYQTRSTYGKPGDTLRLDIDPKSHPAWTGGQQRLIDTGGQLARFNKRFQGFGIKR
jgi:large subunit ribosomal protein L31